MTSHIRLLHAPHIRLLHKPHIRLLHKRLSSPTTHPLRRHHAASARTSSIAIALTLLACALVAVPSAAAADSIAFLRNGNIWRASGDGSHQVQLTHDGTEAEPYNELAAAKGSGAPLLSFRKDYDLGVIDADGSGERMLPELTSGMADTSVSLSASGDTIAYQAQEYGAGLWFDVAITGGVSSDSNLMNFGFFVQWASFANEQGSEVLLSQLAEYGAGDPNCTDAEGNEYFQLAYVDVSQNPGNQLSTICKSSLDEDLRVRPTASRSPSRWTTAANTRSTPSPQAAAHRRRSSKTRRAPLGPPLAKPQVAAITPAAASTTITRPAKGARRIEATKPAKAASTTRLTEASTTRPPGTTRAGSAAAEPRQARGMETR